MGAVEIVVAVGGGAVDLLVLLVGYFAEDDGEFGCDAPRDEGEAIVGCPIGVGAEEKIVAGVGGDELRGGGEEGIERGSTVGRVDHERNGEAGSADAGDSGFIGRDVGGEGGLLVVGPAIEADLVGEVEDDIFRVLLRTLTTLVEVHQGMSLS